MNANRLKGIACLSMLLDHIGYVLFPQVEWLRWCGRLALPIFAFLVAEGCRHTRNRKRYFLRMLGLGLVCQIAALGEMLLGGSTARVALNILLTLSVSQLLCFAWLDFSDAEVQKKPRTALRLMLLVVAAVGGCLFLGRMYPLVGVSIVFDYGLAGMFLPLFALLVSGKWERLLSFGMGLLWVCLSLHHSLPFQWLALLTLPLLALYNGQRGSGRWQYAFYGFYPLHLFVLYGIQWLWR